MCVFRSKMAINNNDDCYGYMRSTHLLAVCWGYPITRRRTINDNSKHDVESVVEGKNLIHVLRIDVLLYIILNNIL